jgi:hypothetical protein
LLRSRLAFVQAYLKKTMDIGRGFASNVNLKRKNKLHVTLITKNCLEMEKLMESIRAAG